MIKYPLIIGAMAIPLIGCSQMTSQNIEADIQEAAFISCLLSDGSQVFYSVSSEISNPQSKVVQTSNKIAQGSTALCNGLQKINAHLNSTPTSPAPTSTPSQ